MQRSRRCDLLARCIHLAYTLAPALLIAAPVAMGHPSTSARLSSLQPRWEAEVCDAPGALRRGRLHVERREFQAATAWFDRAVSCDPRLTAVDLARAEAHLSAGDTTAAIAAATRYLAHQSHDGAARIVRARAYARAGHWALAARDYDRGAAALASPQPDHLLERARAHLAAGDADSARRGLDQAIATIGPAAALIELAVDLDLAAARYDAALATLARLHTKQRSSLSWTLRRAEILAAAGRGEEMRRWCSDSARDAASRSLSHRQSLLLQQLQRCAAGDRISQSVRR
ncbi:MAG TPA: hypothetical protein VEB21_10525 [Terriglobales bacterium]|nr:hypothetical protein [Terriglobales bacterium]